MEDGCRMSALGDAGLVRRIFRMASDGMSMQEIARRLNLSEE